MDDTSPIGGRNSQRQGSPKPQKRFSVRHTRKEHKSRSQVEVLSPFSVGYNSHAFTITAYLPYDGGKRLKLQCSPGMTVQQVIEMQIPDISRTGYQVYHFPSRALLNPEKDASVLQDQEISIEPMRLRSPDNVGDERLAIVKELLRTEDAYLENLRNIFDIYMEPLRKWGLAQNDMNTLFRPLSRLCDLLMNFFSELELAVQYWNTNTTQIGGLFKQYPSFWDMYEEYNHSYTRACKLLKDKRMMDESFNSFLELKRGAARHTLESLMLLPVQRIYDYHRLLVQLYTITPKDHFDYHDLRFAVASVSAMVQSREKQLSESENEAKLEQVQLRFPSDDLFLNQSLNIMESAVKRAKSASTPGSHRSLRHTKQSSFDLDHTDIGEVTKRGVRLYLQEGPVKIITGLQSHERYFFLFDDILIIGKPTGRHRSQQRLYKRKEQLRLSEMWVTDCMGEVMVPTNTAFVLGWPVTNCVAAFSSPEEKNLWYNVLSKTIVAQRKALQPDVVSVQIVNLTKSSNNIPTMMQVHCTEQTKDVLLRALDMLAIAVSETNCQMWVKFSKEEAAYPLIGHECPFAIQVHHNRQQMDLAGESRPTQIQFVIKRRSPMPSVRKTTQQGFSPDGEDFVVRCSQCDLSSPSLESDDESMAYIVSEGRKEYHIHTENSRVQQRSRKTFRKSNFLAWAKGRWSQDGVSSRRKKYRVFGAPLDTIIINEQLPEILQEMLIRLYTEGPVTLGIFRQSANHRKVKELKEAIDNREQVDLSQVSIHVVGALLKEVLRNVPGCVLMSSRYTEFVATNDIKDIPTRVLHVQRIIGKLPEENQVFLRYLMPLLHHISCKEEINCMNSINLAICFAPSLLWPDLGLDVIKNEVPYLVKFIIELSPDIFGQLPELYRQANLPSSPGIEKMECILEQEVQYVPTKMEDGTKFHHKRTNSLETSTSEESGDDEPSSNLMKVQSSGLTVSDSQLSQISFEQHKPSSRTAGIGVSGRCVTSHEDRPYSSRKVRHPPERSNSYRGPNERPPYQKVRHRPAGDTSRRKSIATQTTLPRKHAANYSSQLEPVPPSPSSSSSQGFSSHVKPVAIDSSYVYHYHQSPPMMKRRKLPQYSHSFSKGSENIPHKPIPTSASTSFYDKLLPLDPELKARSRSIQTNPLSLEHRATHDNWSGPDQYMKRELQERTTPLWTPSQVGRPLQTQAAPSYQSVASSHSASSSSSQQLSTSLHYPPTYLSQMRPNNLSRVSSHSGGSGGSMNKGSPDLLTQLEQTPLSKLDKEFIKIAISKRFDLSSTDNGQTPPHEAPSYRHPGSFNTSSSYGHSILEHDPMRVKSTKASSLDHAQVPVQKLHDRLVDSSSLTTSDSSFSKSHSYHGFVSAHQKKDPLHNIEEQDDRPESEQHLNSLPRHDRTKFVRSQNAFAPEIMQVAHVEPEHDHNRLYPGSGYNSDTESSPSRTLSRPGKLNEVASPTKTTMPHRYRSPMFNPPAEVTRIQQHYTLGEPKQLKSQASIQQENVMRTHHQYMQRHHESPRLPQLIQEGVSATHSSLSKVVGVGHIRSPWTAKEIGKALKQENVTTRRPKSGDPSKACISAQRSADIESDKIKLGLIPRQRSKSTSESEAMKIIHKVLEDDEPNMQQLQASRPTVEDKRAEKHKEWLSSAPTSAERRRAWEQHSRNAPHLQRTDLRSRSLREEAAPSIPIRGKFLTSLTPEVQRKSSTMPEYLLTNSVAGKNRLQLGRGLVRTVKIMSSEVPKPRPIRHIDMKAYC